MNRWNNSLMRLLRRLMLPVTLLLMGALSGCATPDVRQYADQKPALQLERYFNGKVEGWGMFQSRSGEVMKRFHVVIDARWEGNQGVLDERFTWSDGSLSTRVWRLTRQSDGRYSGRADDVVGEAVGEVAGNALRWRYVLALPVDGRVWNLDVDDWMFMVDERVMLNRSVLSKWGFEVGQVTLSFTKLP